MFIFGRMCKILEVCIREVAEYHKQNIIAHSSTILKDSSAENYVDSLDLDHAVSEGFCYEPSYELAIPLLFFLPRCTCFRVVH